MFHKHKWVWIGIAVVVVAGLLAAVRMVRVRKTEKFDVSLGNGKAEVLVTYSRRAASLLGSGARYEVAVKRASGKVINFIMKEQPRAIWQLGSKLYVATYGSAWRFAVVGAQGRPRPVTLAKLPAGPKPINLTDDPAKWEKMLEKATTKPAKKAAVRAAKRATTRPAKAGRRAVKPAAGE